MGMFLCRDLGPGPVHSCIGKTEPRKMRAEEHRLQTAGEGRVLGAGDVLREQWVLMRPGTPGSPAHPAHPKSPSPLHGSAGFNATSGEATGTGTAAPGRGATRSPNQPSVSAVLPPRCFGAWSRALELSSRPPHIPSPSTGRGRTAHTVLKCLFPFPQPGVRLLLAALLGSSSSTGGRWRGAWQRLEHGPGRRELLLSHCLLLQVVQPVPRRLPHGGDVSPQRGVFPGLPGVCKLQRRN